MNLRPYAAIANTTMTAKCALQDAISAMLGGRTDQAMDGLNRAFVAIRNARIDVAAHQLAEGLDRECGAVPAEGGAT